MQKIDRRRLGQRTENRYYCSICDKCFTTTYELWKNHEAKHKKTWVDKLKELI